MNYPPTILTISPPSNEIEKAGFFSGYMEPNQAIMVPNNISQPRPPKGAWLRPVSRGNRHFTVGGGRLRQSGPRPEGRLLRQPAIEGLTRSARMDSPRKVDRNKSDHLAAAAAVMVVAGGF
ncbi:hypothetical protein F511_15000 [Dorcoceras hygrometricum]|uniref:Uncharacterized protein n=1 Tax=Dorcoceras hygrometricum TaxID=472368 RepID=A0A2Z7A7Q2_9LAMI|nr:hypothetical protein F511_15000 [Dorcoceras hygrometricum]